MHQPAGFYLRRRVIGKLFRNSHIAVEILNQDLEISIQLKEWKPGLFTDKQLEIAGIGLVPTVYHWNEPRVGSFLGDFEIQKGPEFFGMLKIELVKATHTGQQHAILEFPHISEGLQYDSWVGRRLDINGEGIERNQALGQVVDRRRGLGLLAPMLLVAGAVPWRTEGMTDGGVVDGRCRGQC